MTKLPNLEDDVMAEINITPFTDVLLVLLIIFMILTAIEAPAGFQKEVSSCRGCSSSAGTPSVPISVEITRTGLMSIDGLPVSEGTLYPRMAAVVNEHTRYGWSTHIALLADRDTAYDLVVKVLDAARQAGDDDVGFVTN